MTTHCKSEHSFDLQDTIKNLGSGSSTNLFNALPIWDAILTNFQKRTSSPLSS
jgi:hypothetical protein